MPEIPQLDWPLRVINGEIATVEQGTPQDALAQTYVLVTTPQGWLTSNPDFGLYEQAHLSGGADAQEIERQLTEYVPDATAAVTEQPDALNPALSIVGVRIGV
jgi:hypothetical protein